MSNSSSDTLLSTVVKGNNTTVAQRKLYLTLTLLVGNLTCHRAVNLVGEPVLAGNSLQLQHPLNIVVKDFRVFKVFNVLVLHGCIVSLHGVVTHDGLGRVTEHLGNVEVERLDAVALDKREVGIARGLTDHIQRRTLTLSNLTHVFNVFLVNQQSHAFLTLIGNDFLCRERLVTDGKLRHVDSSSALFNQFAQTVQVSGTSMVMNGDDRILIFLYKCTNEIVGTLLHFRVSTLNGIQFDAVAVTACIYR